MSGRSLPEPAFGSSAPRRSDMTPTAQRSRQDAGAQSRGCLSDEAAPDLGQSISSHTVFASGRFPSFEFFDFPHGYQHGANARSRLERKSNDSLLNRQGKAHLVSQEEESHLTGL